MSYKTTKDPHVTLGGVLDVYNWFSWFHPPHIVYSICFFILPGYIRQIRNFILRYNSLLIWPERGILKWTRVFGADLQVRENRSTSVLILIKSFINKSELCRGKRTLMKIYSLGIELLSSPLRSECIFFMVLIREVSWAALDDISALKAGAHCSLFWLTLSSKVTIVFLWHQHLIHVKQYWEFWKTWRNN